MNQLDKVASVCAEVFLKRATPQSAFSRTISQGDDLRAAFQDLFRAQHRAATAGQMPDWLKAVLGIGGGAVVLDKVNNRTSSDWRR